MSLPNRLWFVQCVLVSMLVASLAIVPGVALAAPVEPPGAASPEALVARLNKAQAAGDLGELVNCIEPEGRAEMSGVFLAGALMMVSFMDLGGEMAAGMAEGMAGEEMTAEQKAEMEKGKQEAAKKSQAAKASLSAVLEKHGLPDLLDEGVELPEEGPDSLLSNVDQGALVRDLMGVLEGIGLDASEEAGSEMPVSATITDYEVDGDRATARAGEETVEFVRLEGRWFLEAPEETAEPAPLSE